MKKNQPKKPPMCSSFPSLPPAAETINNPAGTCPNGAGKINAGKGKALSQTQPGENTHLEHQGGQLEDGLAVHLDLPLLRREHSVSRARPGEGGEGAPGEAVPAPAARPELPAPCPPAVTAHTQPVLPSPSPALRLLSLQISLWLLFRGVPLRGSAPERAGARPRTVPARAMRQGGGFDGSERTPSSGRGSQVWFGLES